jgi:hypothetical protein
MGSTLAPLTIGHTVMNGNRFSKNTPLWKINSLYNIKQYGGCIIQYKKFELTKI